MSGFNVRRHQYGISALVPQTSFRGETRDGVAKCRLFSQAIECFHMTSRRPCWCPKTIKRRPRWCPKPVS